jgi:hypothetical protein
MRTGLAPVITKLNAALAERYWTESPLTGDEMEALHLLERAKVALTQARAKLQKAEVEKKMDEALSQ